MRLNADHYRAFKLLGSALYALGDLTGAERALRDSLAIQPSYSDALCDLGGNPHLFDFLFLQVHSSKLIDDLQVGRGMQQAI